MGLTCDTQTAKLAIILLAFILLCHGIGNVDCRGNRADQLSLLDFKKGITNDPYGALATWNTSTHFCRWQGVKCTSTGPWRVMALNLSSQSLTGQIRSSLGNLSFLNILDLGDNNLLGSLPRLGNLKQLQALYLYKNNLTGIIPDELTNCSSLTYIDLSGNALTGALPPNLGSLSNLAYLYLSANKLTGTIPQALGNITTLVEIYLDTNRFEGGIPDKLWQLPNLTILALGQNMLSGDIPFNFSSLSLQLLSLEYNMFGKVLPQNISDMVPNLQILRLDYNMFQGQIPSSLGNALQLTEISMANNYFTGQIPSSFGKLSKLSYISLENNSLEASDGQGWEFLHALRNCSNLELLSLAQNQLQGEIPNSIGDLPLKLQQLVLSENKLSGEVPASIGNLQGLFRLSLDLNNLTGKIDEWVPKLTKLQKLLLHRNNFSGSIPSSIAELPRLSTLSLAYNAFDGPIPSSLGNLSGLQKLYLSHNNLEGVIPPELSYLKQLINLSLSENKLTGEIPGTLSQCKDLANIQMGNNFLTGNIPVTFGDLKSLGVLNLSHNSLSGTIPTTLNDLPVMSKLDLSYNRLQGKIPMTGIFANPTVVSVQGNIGLCGGVMDLRMPPCQVVSQRRKTQYYLIRVLIPIFGFMSLILVVYFLLLEKMKPREKYISSQSFGENFLKVSYNDLAQATRNFSEANLIGKGSYGTVYRGKLKECKLEVAVKVFDLEMRGAERSFISECEALRSIQHRNLLPIITACSTVDSTGNVFKALVYEYMPNGNLDTWIHDKEGGKAPGRLGLRQTISICVNIADALDYLHHECGRTTIHCDLKPSNILLADDMNALLGDFGIARFYIDSWSTSTGSNSTVGVKGTIGYIPPGN